MAVPAYTTDLTTNEIFLDGGGTGWTMVGGGRETDPETDDFIQGSSCWSHDPFSSGIEGGVYPSSQTIASGDVVLFWLKCDVVATLATKAAGGMQALIGSSATAYKSWYVRGSDDYAAGGWVCVAIDPTVTQSFVTSPAPTTTTSWFGARWNVPSSGASKGYPMKADAIRQGRGQLLINGGQSGSLATFVGLAAVNDAQSAKWGLFEAQEGGAAGYRWKGLMSFGPTSLTEFTDSNKNIFIENTEYVGSSFNRIEINNASSVINWTNINITALGTNSKGEFEMIDDATVNFTGCVFTDMSTFIFDSKATIDGCTFRRCGEVTQAGADLDNCIFEKSAAATALLVDDPDNIDNCSFVSDGTGHAIELDTACAGNSYTLTDFFVSGYAASDGSTGNEVILNSSGGTVTLNIDGGSGVSALSIKGGNVTLVANYSFTVTGLESGTEVTIVTSGTSTVLHHTESASTSDGDGKYQITYSHGGGATVDVLIHHIDYQPDISNIYGLTLPGNNSSAKVKQFPDLNYENP